MIRAIIGKMEVSVFQLVHKYSPTVLERCEEGGWGCRGVAGQRTDLGLFGNWSMEDCIPGWRVGRSGRRGGRVGDVGRGKGGVAWWREGGGRRLEA